MLKSFAQSRGFIFIDPEELCAAKAWLIKHQRDDGSFPAMGRILNKDLQVGLSQEDALWRKMLITSWDLAIMDRERTFCCVSVSGGGIFLLIAKSSEPNSQKCLRWGNTESRRVIYLLALFRRSTFFEAFANPIAASESVWFDDIISSTWNWLWANEFLCSQGGIHGKISLTAYVVAALLETGITTEVNSPTKKTKKTTVLNWTARNLTVLDWFIHYVSSLKDVSLWIIWSNRKSFVCPTLTHSLQ